MCNLYSHTSNRSAIAALVRDINRVYENIGNLEPQPGIFPDYLAPIVRNTPEGRELAKVRWGLPSSQKAIADTDSPCRCKSSIIIVSLSLITNAPLPTIGRSIGDDVPPVFQGAPRKTGGTLKLGKIQTALLGSIEPVMTEAIQLQRPLPDGVLKIVAVGKKQDQAA